MEQASALFHERILGRGIPSHDLHYREALFHLLAAETSCYRYWGEGVWTDYGAELARRTAEIVTNDFGPSGTCEAALPDVSTFPRFRAGTVGRQPRAVLLHQDQTNQSPQGLPELALAAAQRRLQQPEADGDELVGLGPIQALGGHDREPVGRHHHGMGHPGVRLAKLSTSQLKSAASLLSWGMASLTRWRR
jgi:hypothetical protein